MELHYDAEPSALPEYTELSLTLGLLVAMGAFLGSFTIQHFAVVLRAVGVHLG